jgi:hypothetical protein
MLLPTFPTLMCISESPGLRRRRVSMATIDALDWAGGLAFWSYGLKIGVRVSDRSVLKDIINYLPPGWRSVGSPSVDRLYSLQIEGRGSERDYWLWQGSEQLVRTADQDVLFELFQSDLHLYVAEFARQRLFVHAGAVGWHGRAIIIPGRSMSGKSTLVEALIRAGASYYSDEYAVLDSHGQLHPFARPLSLRGGAGERPRRLHAETLGSVGTQPLPVALVAMLHYKPDEPWRPQRLSAGSAVLEMLANTVPARRRPERAFQTLGQVASCATVIKGARGDAHETAMTLLKAVGAGMPLSS